MPKIIIPKYRNNMLWCIILFAYFKLCIGILPPIQNTFDGAHYQNSYCPLVFTNMQSCTRDGGQNVTLYIADNTYITELSSISILDLSVPILSCSNSIKQEGYICHHFIAPSLSQLNLSSIEFPTNSSHSWNTYVTAQLKYRLKYDSSIMSCLMANVLYFPVLDHSWDNCTKDTYSIRDRPQDSARCMSCPNGAFCPGGPRIWPVAGYWSINERSITPIQCLSREACPGSMGQRKDSFNEYNINNNITANIFGKSTSKCGKGYTDVACSRCEDGYYFDDRRCRICSNNTRIISDLLFVFIFYISLCIFIGYALFHWNIDTISFITTCLLNIQMFSACGKLGVQSLPDNNTWVIFYDILSLFNLDSSILSWECYLSHDTSFSSYLVSLRINILLLIIVFFISIFAAKYAIKMGVLDHICILSEEGMLKQERILNQYDFEEEYYNYSTPLSDNTLEMDIPPIIERKQSELSYGTPINNNSNSNISNPRSTASSSVAPALGRRRSGPSVSYSNVERRRKRKERLNQRKQSTNGGSGLNSAGQSVIRKSKRVGRSSQIRHEYADENDALLQRESDQKLIPEEVKDVANVTHTQIIFMFLFFAYFKMVNLVFSSIRFYMRQDENIIVLFYDRATQAFVGEHLVIFLFFSLPLSIILTIICPLYCMMKMTEVNNPITRDKKTSLLCWWRLSTITRVWKLDSGSLYSFAFFLDFAQLDSAKYHFTSNRVAMFNLFYFFACRIFLSVLTSDIYVHLFWFGIVSVLHFMIVMATFNNMLFNADMPYYITTKKEIMFFIYWLFDLLQLTQVISFLSVMKNEKKSIVTDNTIMMMYNSIHNTFISDNNVIFDIDDTYNTDSYASLQFMYVVSLILLFALITTYLFSGLYWVCNGTERKQHGVTVRESKLKDTSVISESESSLIGDRISVKRGNYYKDTSVILSTKGGGKRGSSIRSVIASKNHNFTSPTVGKRTLQQVTTKGQTISLPGMSSEDIIEEANTTVQNEIDETDIEFRRGRLIGDNQDPQEPLGKYIGGGNVYLAMNSNTGALLAVKQFSCNPITFNVTNFLSEMQTFLSIDHTNILQIYGVSIAEDDKAAVASLLMEYIAGQSISDLVLTYGNFTEDVIAQYALQVLFALSYLSETLNREHGFLTSKNILVSSAGVVKLSGLEKKVLENHIRGNEKNALKRRGKWISVADTLCCPPEQSIYLGISNNANNNSNPNSNSNTKNNNSNSNTQTKQQRNVSETHDIWSLGCVLVEMATCDPLFDEEVYASERDAIEVITALYSTRGEFVMHKGEQIFPPQFPSDVSALLQDFIMCCLQIDPNNRCSIAELLEHEFLDTAWEFYEANEEFTQKRGSITHIGGDYNYRNSISHGSGIMFEYVDTIDGNEVMLDRGSFSHRGSISYNRRPSKSRNIVLRNVEEEPMALHVVRSELTPPLLAMDVMDDNSMEQIELPPIYEESLQQEGKKQTKNNPNDTSSSNDNITIEKYLVNSSQKKDKNK